MTAAVVEAPAPAGVLETLRGTPPSVRAVLLGTLVNRLGAFLQVFLVLYLVAGGYSPAQAGLALGAHGLGGVAGGVLGGWLTDRISTRRTMIVTSTTAGLGTVGILAAPGLPAVLATVTLVGMAANAYRPAAAAALAEHTPEARYTLVFAMQRLATNIGTTVGPLLGAFIAGISYPALFWIEGTVTAAVGLVTALAVPASRPAAKATAERRPVTARGSVLADRRFVLFLTGVLLSSVVYVQYLSTLPLHVADLGHTTAVFAVLVAVNGVIVMLFELPATKLTQAWPVRPVLVANVLLVGLGMALYWLPAGLAGLVVATVVWSLGEIVGAPTMFAHPARIAPRELRGRYLGAMNSVVGAAFALGPVLGGLGYVALGATVWPLCALVSLAAAAAVSAGTARSSDEPLDDRHLAQPRPAHHASDDGAAAGPGGTGSTGRHRRRRHASAGGRVRRGGSAGRR